MACHHAAQFDHRLARSAQQVIDDRSSWLQEYVTTDRLGESFGHAVQSLLSTNSNGGDVSEFLDVGPASHHKFVVDHREPIGS